MQAPSVEHLPAEIETTELGDAAIELARLAGLDLDPWQSYVLRTSLAKQSDDLWSAFLVGCVVSRQNGKGSILEARELAGLFLPDLSESLILHSAHEFKTCYEHFLRITQLIESTPELDRQVQKIRRGVGEQAVELRNGNRLRFIARSSGSGRGMSAPCVVLDEAMFLTEAQIGAIMPTLSAQENPQLWFTSSAPLSSSVALHRLRKSAIEGSSQRLFYAEWGNDATADPFDPAAVARANPALGQRIFMDFVETEREAMSVPEFARERLGVPEPMDSETNRPIALDRWAELTDGDSTPDTGTVRLSLDAPPERTSATFCIAGKRADNLHHVEVLYHVPPAEMRDLVSIAAKACTDFGVKLVMPPGSPARAWKPDLEAAGVPLDEMTPAEYAEACGYIATAVMKGSLRHRGQPEMNGAVEGLMIRTSGDVDVWSRRHSAVNIAPFVAATCALARVPVSAPPRGVFVDVT